MYNNIKSEELTKLLEKLKECKKEIREYVLERDELSKKDSNVRKYVELQNNIDNISNVIGDLQRETRYVAQELCDHEVVSVISCYSDEDYHKARYLCDAMCLECGVRITDVYADICKSSIVIGDKNKRGIPLFEELCDLYEKGMSEPGADCNTVGKQLQKEIKNRK